MRIFWVLCATILCFTTCGGNGKTKQNYQPKADNKAKPYNPEKAGAVILNSYDITDKIAFLETEVYEGYHIYFTMKTDYGLGENNERIYIRIKKTLYVFDKNSIKKQAEIAIKLPEKYDFLPNGSFSTPGRGFAVSGNHAFVCFTDNLTPPWPSYLFIVDLDTGNARYISEEKLGMNYNNRRHLIMGYDKQKDALWFRMEAKDAGGGTKVFIHYFKYDNNADSFVKIGEALWGSEVNRADKAIYEFPPRASLIASSISGNESWNVYMYRMNRQYEDEFFVVDRRNMDSLTEPASSIDVSHLGTLSVPQSIIYDKPYLWIMAERDERIQMLKLLPNE
jgi:hypothetical protein